MTAINTAIVEAHRRNLARYCQLLATELTQLERDFLHRRIAETRAAIEELETLPAVAARQETQAVAA